MAIEYRQIVDCLTVIQVTRDGIISYVPCDEMNKDYREYLEWEAIEGNDILAPEE